MPLFLVEREYAERLELSPEMLVESRRSQEELGIEWITSFLRADQKKTYCLYEAPSVEAIREDARRRGIPADVIVAVDRFGPEDLERQAVESPVRG